VEWRCYAGPPEEDEDAAAADDDDGGAGAGAPTGQDTGDICTRCRPTLRATTSDGSPLIRNADDHVHVRLLLVVAGEIGEKANELRQLIKLFETLSAGGSDMFKDLKL
jgi:hypothetical protein